MSDSTTPTATPAPVEAAPQEPTAAAPEANEPLGDAGKSALDSERKARREADRQVKDLAAKLQAIEDRDKTEAQKLADNFTKAQKDRADTLAENALLKAGLKYRQLTEDDLELIGSNGTPEEIDARAAKLAARLGATPKLPAAPPAAGQGNVGAPIGDAVSNLQAAIDAATKAGKHVEAIALKRQLAQQQQRQ